MKLASAQFPIPAPDRGEARLFNMIEYLRSVVLAQPEALERFHVVFVDAKRRYIGAAAMGQGAISVITLRMRELFRSALALNATAIIVAHNHPSGDCRPSETDITETRRLAAIAEALDIELIDHLIFTPNSLYSMRAGGDL